MNREEFKSMLRETFEESITELCDSCRVEYSWDPGLDDALDKIYDKVRCWKQQPPGV